jgi:hypothetical protein
MVILTEARGNAAVLKMSDVSDGAEQIVVGVDASSNGWRAILQLED